MKFTENFKLKKPEQTDSYNVEDFNENADVVDAKLKKFADLLTVEDISDSFIGEVTDEEDVAIFRKQVYKQGNVISGTVTLEGKIQWLSGILYQHFSIADKYKPRNSVVAAQVLACISYDPSDEVRLPCVATAWLQNGCLYSQSVSASDDGLFTHLFVSFSYICQ